MICQLCQNRTASVHIVQKSNAGQIEIFLCEKCAQENPKINIAFPNSNANFEINFSNILPGLIGGNLHNIGQAKKVRCENCGMTFEDFQKIGKLGCGNCYETFFNELAPVISRIHGNVEYKGEMPGNSFKEDKELDQLQILRRDLKEAISKEEYESAASIRDKIRDIESKIGDESEL